MNDVKNARYLVAGDAPLGGIVLASESVEAAAGDSELLADVDELGDHALGCPAMTLMPVAAQR
ncbi:hypothetical protein [Streptomyces sp. NPDC050485]|uniref:hypothetical protein n=1 Tax=Streptomyces sp. NPDC050485 TaxID=3365617 RepID=UPI0037898072